MVVEIVASRWAAFVLMSPLFEQHLYTSGEINGDQTDHVGLVDDNQSVADHFFYFLESSR
jgi:hypothetical protein